LATTRATTIGEEDSVGSDTAGACVFHPYASVAQQAAAPPASTAPLLDKPQLDQLVAPIALYPDPLLAQVLMASTYPLDVVEAARWADAQ
jgi:hypothetical protein